MLQTKGQGDKGGNRFWMRLRAHFVRKTNMHACKGDFADFGNSSDEQPRKALKAFFSVVKKSPSFVEFVDFDENDVGAELPASAFSRRLWASTIDAVLTAH